MQRDGDELMIVQSRQQARQYSEDNRPAICHASSMAIVHEQNVAGAEVAGQALENSLGVSAAGVVGAARPARQLQAEAVQYGIEEGIAQAGGGAEVARRRCPSDRRRR